MKITGHLTRSVFDRYDITSEEDLAEASRKLQALTGTIAGTNASNLRVACRPKLAHECRRAKVGGEGQNRTVDTTIFSRMLYQLSYLAHGENRENWRNSRIGELVNHQFSNSPTHQLYRSLRS
jgi:hypothetical protein